MEKKKRSGWWEWIITGLLFLLVVCLLFIFLGNIDKNPIYSIRAVTSDSMKPVFSTGDIIIISKTEKEVQIGDIVSFVGPNGEIITHRVIGFDGTQLITKGDNSEDEDVWSNGWSLQKENICGWYLFRIPKVGYFFNWFSPSRAQMSDSERGSIGIEAGIFTPTPTPELTPDPSATLELDLTPSLTPESTPTPDPSASSSLTPESTPTPDPSASSSLTPESTPTPDPSASSSLTPESTPTPDPSASSSLTPTVTSDTTLPQE